MSSEDQSGKSAGGAVYRVGGRDRQRDGGMVAGMTLVTIGTIFFGERMHWGHNWNMGHLWPLILIAVGVGKIMRNPRCVGSTVWMIGIGTLFLLNQFHVLMIHQAWPLFFILGGFWIVFSGRRSARSANDTSGGGSQ